MNTYNMVKFTVDRPQLISSVVTQNWGDIVQSCALDNWKEALAALLTYAHPKEFAHLCGKNQMLRGSYGSPQTVCSSVW